MTKIPCPLTKNALERPLDPAIISGGQAITYHQFNMLVSSAAVFLKTSGVKPNSRVAILSLNNVEYVILFFALWRLKAIACPLSIYLPEETIQEQLSTIQAKIFITDFEDHLESKTIKCTKIMLKDIFQNFYKVPPKKTTIDLNQNATIIFTSGSSNKPKAVLHTYGNHYYNALGANLHISFERTDRWLLVLPLYHVGGLSILFRVVLGKGAIYLPVHKEPLADIIDKHKITHVSLVTTQFFRVLKDDDSTQNLKSLKAVILGGSAIAESFLTKALNKRLPVYTTYGLTEMASQVATSDRVNHESQFHKARILKYRKVRLAPHGEILVKGETLFKGYVSKNKIYRPMDTGGWFHTGDLGQLHRDGSLSVLGRKDNMFISGGENIQPEEIEHYICQLDDVETAIVVPIFNEEFGTRPIAFVKTKNNAKLNRRKILAHLNKHLPKFKIPEGIVKWPVELEGGIKTSRHKAHQIARKRNPEQGIFN